jgi:ABC-type cobalamin/Fe3+-siderophores transport systems, ATPase components
MKEILNTRQLEIGYAGKALLPSLNVSMNEGDVVALAGPNGAGKTTLFKTFCANIKPVKGEILLFGKDLQSFTATERASLFSIVLTDKPDDLFLKVHEIVAAGRYPYIGMMGRLSKNDMTQIKESLEMVGIADLANRNFISLSDGENKKL